MATESGGPRPKRRPTGTRSTDGPRRMPRRAGKGSARAGKGSARAGKGSARAGFKAKAKVAPSGTVFKPEPKVVEVTSSSGRKSTFRMSATDLRGRDSYSDEYLDVLEKMGAPLPVDA